MGELQQVTNLFDMTTDYKVTELFCIIDEFCKHFEAENAGNLLEDNSGAKRRRRQASLSDSEIMTILLYFHFGTFRNFKHYYLFFIKGTMKSYFPKAVSYNRFVELESRVWRNTAGDRVARKHEKQADAVLWQNDAPQEIHYRNH